ncbi:hypothetical protein C8F01DRAFT_1138024, partial [Mycena amicta]
MDVQSQRSTAKLPQVRRSLDEAINENSSKSPITILSAHECHSAPVPCPSLCQHIESQSSQAENFSFLTLISPSLSHPLQPLRRRAPPVSPSLGHLYLTHLHQVPLTRLHPRQRRAAYAELPTTPMHTQVPGLSPAGRGGQPCRRIFPFTIRRGLPVALSAQAEAVL